MTLSDKEFIEFVVGVVENDSSLAVDLLRAILKTMSDNDARLFVEDIYYDKYCCSSVYLVQSCANPGLRYRFHYIEDVLELINRESLDGSPYSKSKLLTAIKKCRSISGFWVRVIPAKEPPC